MGKGRKKQEGLHALSNTKGGRCVNVFVAYDCRWVRVFIFLAVQVFSSEFALLRWMAATSVCIFSFNEESMRS